MATTRHHSRSSRRVGACVAASLLVHVLSAWLTDAVYQPDAPGGRIQLRDPAQRPDLVPFRRQRDVFIPRNLQAARWIPLQADARRIDLTEQTIGHDLLRQGVAGQDSVEPAIVDTLGVPALAARLAFDRRALQTWRDSLDRAATQRYVEPDRPITPYEAAIRALDGTVVLVDPKTGRLVRATWHIPVYGNEGCVGCLPYNREYSGWRRSFLRMFQGEGLPIVSDDPFADVRQQRPQGIPVRAVLNDAYSFNAQPRDDRVEVRPDALHTYGWQPYRDVLDPALLQRHPVILLRWIDAESTPVLVDYLIAGGFAVLSARGAEQRLQALEVLLASRVGSERVAVVPILSDHPLMSSWFDIDIYYAAPGGDSEAPVLGLQLDDRIVAVAVLAGRRQVVVNALVFGMVQPSALGGRYPSY